jgi:thiamine kinase-like enzyme
MHELSPPPTHITIHGAPHSYNILLVEGEPRFIDFETTCVGPCEWDLAHTDSEVSEAYSRVTNFELLRVCRDMVSLKTAAWCWADVERGDLRYHAEIHLAQVKRSFHEDA